MHMSGAPADIKALRKIADRRKLFLLEDCAQCAGGSVDSQPVGTFGDMGIFSFQMNKNMTAGEGGAVVTNSGGSTTEHLPAMTLATRATSKAA